MKQMGQSRSSTHALAYAAMKIEREEMEMNDDPSSSCSCSRLRDGLASIYFYSLHEKSKKIMENDNVLVYPAVVSSFQLLPLSAGVNFLVDT